MVPAAYNRALSRIKAIVTATRHSEQQRFCSGHDTFRESCTPSKRPPCPPCQSPAPPPCRRTTCDTPRAIRKVCCAPPVGHRPPCPPTEPPCTRTCQNKSEARNRTMELRQVTRCGAQLDRVAQRLAAAESRRREQYEEEARHFAQPHVTPQPVKPYNLGGEQHCARATDGHDYMCAQSPPPARTCINGVPPPPTPVPLKSSQGCEVQSSHHLDPCAHKPRVFVEIDRSATNKPTEKTHVPKNANSSCARKQCETKKQLKEWCKTPPQLANVPPPCREPSLVERLRRGIGGTETKPSHRALHTRSGCLSAAFSTSGSGNASNLDTLSTVLKDLEKYEEAGRGRTVGLGIHDDTKIKKSNLGSLELPIPLEADAVRVSVTVDVAESADNVTDKQATSKCIRRGSSDSWLSIKNIQKKLTSSKKRSDLKPSEKETSCPVRPRVVPANPCAPSRSRPSNSPRTPSGADPCAPKDNRTRSACTFCPPQILA